jgi:hypothetical protein
MRNYHKMKEMRKSSIVMSAQLTENKAIGCTSYSASNADRVPQPTSEQIERGSLETQGYKRMLRHQEIRKDSREEFAKETVQTVRLWDTLGTGTITFKM